MDINKKFYDEESIQSLSPLEFTRLRPQVYCGSTEYSTQLLSEVFSNSVDEFKAGHCSTINIILNKDIVIVEDDGQGFIPMSYREDGKTVLEASFSVLNTSGKFTEEGVYEGVSLGLYGIGAKLPIFLSTESNIISYHNNEYEQVWFKNGEFLKRDNGKLNHHSGTIVTWKPDSQFFTHTEVEIDKVKKLFKTIACLCPGLTINLDNNGEKITYFSEKGLIDLVKDGVGDKEIIDNRFIVDFVDGKNKLDLVMTYTSNYSSTIIPYVNTGLTETGPHITQFKAQMTKCFNKFLRDKKWLKEKDENLTGDDIQEGMYLVFNITAPGVSYDAQVKSRITKIDMKPFITPFGEALTQWFEANEKEVKTIADKAITARKAREAAKKTRDNIREKDKKKEKALKFDSKLADCYSKDRKKCEIYITEGDSASGNLKTARDNEYQAVMPVRGKILNTQKATIEQIQKNAEIMSMIDAFGLTIDLKTMKVTYKPEDLRYGKIIIMSDADVDGAHIKNLFYTFIWNFCPQLIQDGYVYAGVPPLYKVTMNKKYKYIKNDEELEAFREANKGKSYQVNRMKGLGEMNEEETEETLTDPNQRIIKQITVDDIKATDRLFSDLMGTAIIPRKKFIQERSKEAIGNV